MKDASFVVTEDFLKALLTVPDAPVAIKISPDGNFVAWSWAGPHETSEIYLAPSDGSAPPRCITSGPGDKIVKEWFSDGRRLLVSVTYDGAEKVRLFRVDPFDDGVLVPLTPADPDYYIMGGTVHPREPWLFYAANRDPRTGQAIDETVIYRQDLITGALEALAQTEKSIRVEPKLSPSGKWLCYRRRDRHRDGRQIWIVASDGSGGDRECVHLGDAVKLYAHWHPDRDDLVIVAEIEAVRKVGLSHLDGTLTWMIDDASVNLAGAHWPRRSDHLVACAFDDACLTSMLVSAGGQRNPVRQADGHTLTPIGPLADDTIWAAIYYRADQPADIVAWSPGDGRIRHSLSRLWSWTSLRRDDLAVPESRHYEADDGLRIQGWFYRAREDVAQGAKGQGAKGQGAKGTIIHVHGGPTYHFSNEFQSLTQYLVAAGFNVFEPNYRGSTGFSLAFQDAVKIDGWGGAEQNDIRAGIDHLIAQGLAQPGKIGITGVSYGGYSSWWAITHFPVDRVAAAAPVCGMTDLVVDYETTRPDLRGYSEEMMGGTPDEVPQRYRERSPIHYVDRIKGKLLIVQGLTDPNVTPENVTAVEGALQQAGIAYEKLTFNDEGHGIHKPRNRAVLYRRLDDFFTRAFASS